jgi:hypothetical protein
MCTMEIWLCTTFLGLCIQCTYDCAQHSWGYVYNAHMTVHNIPGVMYVHCTHNSRNVVHSHMSIVYITPGMLYTAICPLYNDCVQHSWGYVYNEHMTVYNIPRVMYTLDIWLCTTFLVLCIQWTYDWQSYGHCTHNPRNVVHSHMFIVHITPRMLYTVICPLYT